MSGKGTEKTLSLVLDSAYHRIVRLLNIGIIIAIDRATSEATLWITTSIRSDWSDRCNLTIGLAFGPVVSGSFDSEVDKVVGNVVAFWTLVTDLLEMLGCTFGLSGVNELSLC